MVWLHTHDAYTPIIVNLHLPQVAKWVGFVSIICPQGWGICPRIFIVFAIPIQNVGNLQHYNINCPQGWGICQTTLANHHTCSTWGRWGVIMIVALKMYIVVTRGETLIYCVLVPSTTVKFMTTKSHPSPFSQGSKCQPGHISLKQLRSTWDYRCP